MKLSHILDEKLQANLDCRSTGLVHPNGKVLEVDFFRHLESAKNHPEFLTDELKHKLQEYQDELSECEKSCYALIHEGEHPCWHNYEMLESDLNGQFLEDLYNAGYLRFYIHFKREPGQTFGEPQIYANVTLEGKKMGNHMGLISYLQNKYRVRLKIEKR
jgi:hypothetical protein